MKSINIKNVAIFDNGGKSLDRYTVIMPDGEMYSMDHQPNYATGVCQNLGNVAGKYYFHSFGLGWQTGRTDKQINKMLRDATKKQVAIFSADQTWYGSPIAFDLLPERVQETILNLSLNQ